MKRLPTPVLETHLLDFFVFLVSKSHDFTYALQINNRGKPILQATYGTLLALTFVSSQSDSHISEKRAAQQGSLTRFEL